MLFGSNVLVVPQPVLVWLMILVVDSARYVLVAGLAFLVFWRWGRERFRHRLIQGDYPRVARMVHDAKWSVSTIVIFSLFGLGVHYAGRHGLLRRYADVEQYGWAWLVASVAVLVVLQDAYFYWTHRAMHHPWLYRFVHRVHHRSTNPSPWTAYAFSPAEAIVHATFVPLAWSVLPLHEGVVFAFLAIMIVFNVFGHLSMELRSPGTSRHPILGRQTTQTHHALHHRGFRWNYGLYFTFWDRVMGTEHPAYDATFERVAGAPDPHAASGGLRGQVEADG
jgi:Delta7-sterol 5-desaturase